MITIDEIAANLGRSPGPLQHVVIDFAGIATTTIVALNAGRRIWAAYAQLSLSAGGVLQWSSAGGVLTGVMQVSGGVPIKWEGELLTPRDGDALTLIGGSAVTYAGHLWWRYI